MTPQLRARLQQLLAKQGKDVTEADLIRQAIPEFLDRQEDITGSRAQWDSHAPPRNPEGCVSCQSSTRQDCGVRISTGI